MKLAPTGAARLLIWFDSHRRELPWRRSTDPYRVWISEIMLQQTQVDRVVPYFDRFVERFPTVEDLAEGSIDEVLALWSGLGYYRRARWLHAAARQIVADGAFPTEIDSWKKLPGVGPYTAAAVASISFGRREPAVDGNVERVVSRLHAIGGDIKKDEGRKSLLDCAMRLLDERRPGDSNQALMELGATICRRRNPDCSICPLSVECVAFSQGTMELFPSATTHRQKVQQRHLGVVVEESGKILLFRRSDGAALLAGLWEIPWIPWAKGDGALAGLALRYGGRWQLQSSCGWIRHSITHRDIRIEVVRGRLSTRQETAEGAEAGWFRLDEMKDVALSSLVQKILKLSLGDA